MIVPTIVTITVHTICSGPEWLIWGVQYYGDNMDNTILINMKGYLCVTSRCLHKVQSSQCAFRVIRCKNYNKKKNKKKYPNQNFPKGTIHNVI